MKISKMSFSERSHNNSSTQKNGCGCINKGNSKEAEEEVDIKIEK